ncbi:MAG: radical SAM protein [Tissierellia bacterium]|nr:radical SAM protein [Tissierellia bacterium]
MSKKRYIIPIFVPHLGCPHDCIFCNQRKITNQEQAVDKEEILDIIETHLSYFHDSTKIKEIAFFGGSFTAIPRNTMIGYLEIAKRYKEKGIIDMIRISTRPDCIDKEILEILKDYLVDIIELGVQSMDDQVLLVNARGHSSEDVVVASKLIKDYGFTLGHQIMPGLYMDSYEKMIDTASKSIEIGPDIVRIYPTLIIKNTALEALYEIGEYKPLTLDEAIDISGELLKMYKDSNINVIRIGLQVTENINLENDVVAGPFHPSLRQLVEQKMYLEKLIEAIEVHELERLDTLEIFANKSILSNVVGQKAHNKEHLMNKYNYKNIRFIPILDEMLYIQNEDKKLEIGIL